MIELININKSFEKNHVLKNVSMSFEPGKMNLIIGASGSGKTTLIKCLIGLYSYDSGKVLFDGQDLKSMGKKEQRLLRKDLGMLFQGGALFDDLSVKENIEFPLTMFTSMTTKEKNDRIDFCLDRVNLSGVHKLQPSELSGGMMKRVAIARAISMNPKYLFCDEPNSGLDPKTSIVIDNLLQEITREYNITTVVNTHDMNSVIEVGDNISFLHQGMLAWKGSKEAIISSQNKELNNFVFASQLFQKLRSM